MATARTSALYGKEFVPGELLPQCAIRGKRRATGARREATRHAECSRSELCDAANGGEHRMLRSGILHHAVIDLAEAQADDVERIVLVKPPRPLRALLRHRRDRTLHIARSEEHTSELQSQSNLVC